MVGKGCEAMSAERETIAADEARRAVGRSLEEDDASLLGLLRGFQTEDPDELRETLAYLTEALDEDRLSDRKLFP